MAWWGWLIVAWLVLVVPAAFFLGAVAAKARERERSGRKHLYDEHEWR